MVSSSKAKQGGKGYPPVPKFFAEHHIQSATGVAFNVCGNFPLTHTHDYWEMIVFHTPCLHRINGKTFEIKKSSLVIVLPEDVHNVTNANWLYTQSNFKITDAMMAELCSVLSNDLYAQLRTADISERTVELSQDASSDILASSKVLTQYQNVPQADTVIISCILSLLGKFYMQSLSNYIFGDAVVPPIIKKALDWMNDPGNFEKPIAKLAEENGYSRGHLARLFQQHCKNTMSETFTACKLRYAQNLLKNTEEKIITIANLVGYQTQSQFDVAFKKTYGITPKAFRKQYISSFELDTVL